MLLQQRWPITCGRHLFTLAILGLTVLLAGGTTCPATKSLTGAGSTFDNLLFSKMFTEYPKAKCGADVNYQSVGSGAGINDLLNNIVAFGATDTPMTDAQLAKSKQGPILHIPVTLGAEAMSYNLNGIPTGTLKLTGPIIANVFLGQVKYWDDPAIKQINSGANLPHSTITVVHRSDGSGTTGIFTNYLSAVSDTWKSQVGAGTTVNWPTGVGGKGNAGVAAAIKSTPGSIGYVELAYTLSNNLPYTLVQNGEKSNYEAGFIIFVITLLANILARVLIVVPSQTFSGLSGGVALGIIMIPIIASTTEDVLRLVPHELREASLALGATEARTILRVVLPAALSGIITGIVLSMARVAGETAPLLMTAFGTQFFNLDITQPMDALPLRVFVFTESPYQIQVNQAYAGSLVLILLILITSFAVRWVTGGFRARG